LKFNVSKNCFRPIPKVESSVLLFEKLNRNQISKNEIEKFIKFKRYVFSYKRKSLRKILKKFNIDESSILDLRAEKLNLNEFISIFRTIKF
jgi:Dimethyladenosine transferase (rRNA methylation)